MSIVHRMKLPSRAQAVKQHSAGSMHDMGEAHHAVKQAAHAAHEKHVTNPEVITDTSEGPQHSSLNTYTPLKKTVYVPHPRPTGPGSRGGQVKISKNGKPEYK